MPSGYPTPAQPHAQMASKHLTDEFSDKHSIFIQHRVILNGGIFPVTRRPEAAPQHAVF
jgi:hypothetical protein